jgi:hypothetical protein
VSIDYRSVSCPHCGAPAGKGCVSPNRTHLRGGGKIRGWHRERIEAATVARQRADDQRLGKRR